jgi:potassium channel subfamily K, other eukaryote
MPGRTIIQPKGPRRGTSDGTVTVGESRMPLYDKHRRSDEDDGHLFVAGPLDDDATTQAIHRYREKFAALLVAGSRLRGLEGHDRYVFERRMTVEREREEEGEGSVAEIEIGP